MNTELTWEERDRMLRDAHRRLRNAQHAEAKLIAPSGAEDIEVETEFSQSFDLMEDVL